MIYGVEFLFVTQTFVDVLISAGYENDFISEASHDDHHLVAWSVSELCFHETRRPFRTISFYHMQT